MSDRPPATAGRNGRDAATLVTVGIGSNIDPQRAIAAGLDRLAADFGPLTISPAYRSAAIGFDGPPFINLVVRFPTRHRAAATAAALRRIEYDHGRAPGATKFSSRQLDLDLLLYGSLCCTGAGLELPRRDILDYAYTLWPLADIAGDELHPALGISYGELRRCFPHAQPLEPITLAWQAPTDRSRQHQSPSTHRHGDAVFATT